VTTDQQYEQRALQLMLIEPQSAREYLRNIRSARGIASRIANVERRKKVLDGITYYVSFFAEADELDALAYSTPMWGGTCSRPRPIP
jgi:hypothetical protein